MFCASQKVFSEYVSVLSRPKFKRVDRAAAAEVLDRIQARTIWAGPVDRPIPALPDPRDEMLLEAAFGTSADLLVTGNLKHFPPHLIPDLRVASPRAALELVAEG